MGNGSSGKILRVDLTTSRIWEETLEHDLYRLFPGGKALAAYLLLRDVPPHVDPLGPDNVLVLATGLLTAAPVATADDLVVPVIRRADRLGPAEIAARRVELAERAHAKKLRLEDLQGGVFTISNLGMYGIDAFSTTVNPGKAAILAVGRIADRVVR